MATPMSQAEINEDALMVFENTPGVRDAFARRPGVNPGAESEVIVMVVIERGTRPGSRPLDAPSSSGAAADKTTLLMIPRGDPSLGQKGLPEAPGEGWVITLIAEGTTDTRTKIRFTTDGGADDKEGHWEVGVKA